MCSLHGCFFRSYFPSVSQKISYDYLIKVWSSVKIEKKNSEICVIRA